MSPCHETGDPGDVHAAAPVSMPALAQRRGQVGRGKGDLPLLTDSLAFLTIVCLLAAIGTITDSPVTVVGAMVFGPAS